MSKNNVAAPSREALSLADLDNVTGGGLLHFIKAIVIPGTAEAGGSGSPDPAVADPHPGVGDFGVLDQVAPGGIPSESAVAKTGNREKAPPRRALPFRGQRGAVYAGPAVTRAGYGIK